MEKKRFILSPCGTSLLTNFTNSTKDREGKELINKYSNEKEKESIPPDDLRQLESIINSVSSNLKNADINEASEMSAEIKGITKICGPSLGEPGEYHFLLSTDTWLGNTTAELVRSWIDKKTQNKVTAYVHKHPGLQTQDLDDFQASLSDLVKLMSKNRDDYKEFNIIFNLTGGFKAVQGFLQSISSFYADKTVYIFERSENLMVIPRLPVRMDADEYINENLILFRKMGSGIPVSETGTIPETLVFKDEGLYQLSPWGEIVWDQTKRKIYQERLLDSPTDQIRFSKDFRKEVSALSSDRIDHINQRIDQLMCYLNDKTNPASLDFKRLKGKPLKESTHEMDAWADKDAKRIFGHFEKNIFVIDHLSKKLQ